jgi:ABC-2 type transport system permease protein
MFMILSSSAMFPLMIMVVLYSSELLWREKLNNVWQYAQTTSTKPFLKVVGKSLVMLLIIELFMLILFVCAVALQLFLSDEKSGYNFDWSVYLQGFFVYTAVKLWMIANFTLLLQIITRQRFVAMALAIGVPMAWKFIPWIKELIFFGALPNMQYSILNGWALNQSAWFVYFAMWLPLLLACWLVAGWMWPNQQLDGVKAYLQQFSQGFKRQGVIFVIPVLLFSFLAFNNYQNEKAFDKHLSGDDITDIRVAYENNYSQFDALPVPNMTHWAAQVDSYPEEHYWQSEGEITLINNQDEAMTEFYMYWTDPLMQVEFTLDGATVNRDFNSKYGQDALAHISFDRLLEAGESRILKFNIINQQSKNSFTGDASFYQTGAFLNSTQFLPSFGISTGMYLRDNEVREEEGLKPRKETPSSKDPEAALKHFAGNNDHVSSEFTISVPDTQTALAPGELINSETKGGRNYFTYQENAKILPFMNISAGEYQIKTDVWSGPQGKQVQLDIYHNEKHDKNIETMMAAMHESLDYYSAEFGEYTLPYLRILEFPYATFAQSFSGTIPFSENMGFVADSRDEKGLDYAFYVTAHEIAHQWFGHQIIMANAKGNKAIMESLAEYAAIKLLEHQRGILHMQRLLKYDQETYLLARTTTKFEETLSTSTTQSHVYYEKGAVMFSMLAFIIGEDNFNQALRDLKADFTNADGSPKKGVYAVVDDLKKALLNNVKKEDKQYKKMVREVFSQRLIFDLQMQQVETTQLENGDWQIDMTLLAKKYFADDRGEETEKTFNYPIEIGFFSQHPKDVANNSPDSDFIIDMQRVELSIDKESDKESDKEWEPTQLSLIVSEKPKYVAIDPWYRFIDKDLTNNYKSVP